MQIEDVQRIQESADEARKSLARKRMIDTIPISLMISESDRTFIDKYFFESVDLLPANQVPAGLKYLEEMKGLTMEERMSKFIHVILKGWIDAKIRSSFGIPIQHD